MLYSCPTGAFGGSVYETLMAPGVFVEGITVTFGVSSWLA